MFLLLSTINLVDYLPSHLLLTLNLLVAVVNTLNIKTHSSKEIALFSFENADVESICCCKQRMKSKQSLFLQNVSKQSSVSCAHLSPHTYTAHVEWCGVGP